MSLLKLVKAAQNKLAQESAYKTLNGNILTTPPVLTTVINADKYAERFKNLHKVSLRGYSESEPITGYRFIEDESIEILYADPLKRSVIFQFSKELDIQLLKTDLNYLLSCQFFYWEDKGMSNIRFARPYIYNVKEEKVLAEE